MVLLHLSVETKHSLETSPNLLQLIKPHKSNIANSTIRYVLHLTLDRLIWLLCARLAHFSRRCNLIFMPGAECSWGPLAEFFFKPGAFFLPRSEYAVDFTMKGFSYGKSWGKTVVLDLAGAFKFNMLLVAHTESHGKSLITCFTWREEVHEGIMFAMERIVEFLFRRKKSGSHKRGSWKSQSYTLPDSRYCIFLSRKKGCLFIFYNYLFFYWGFYCMVKYFIFHI